MAVVHLTPMGNVVVRTDQEVLTTIYK